MYTRGNQGGLVACFNCGRCLSHTFNFPCDLSLLQVPEVFYFISKALHLQGDSAEIEDDIDVGLFCLPDPGEAAGLPINVKALLFLLLHSGTCSLSHLQMK